MSSKPPDRHARRREYIADHAFCTIGSPVIHGKSAILTFLYLTLNANLAYNLSQRGAKMTIKELRESKSLTQKAAAEFCGIPLRTYIRYENGTAPSSIKHNFILRKLEEYGFVDEEHGVLTRQDIISCCRQVFERYPVEYCFLFGSYAKGIAGEKSDVDLLIKTELNGLKYYGLVESLRESLRKKVAVLSFSQLNNNPELLNEILRDGEKIYDQDKG